MEHKTQFRCDVARRQVALVSVFMINAMVAWTLQIDAVISSHSGGRMGAVG